MVDVNEEIASIASDANIQLTFECSQPEGVWWVVEQVSIAESINDPYTMRIHLKTESLHTETLLLLGQSCKLTLQRGSYLRQFTGIVATVEEGMAGDRWSEVDITVVPALHALKLGTDTRIFQDLTVPQILEQVLSAGLSRYERTVDNRCSRTYPICEYRVQYDESDFTFCERLMEEEGIAYWFEFEEDQEVMVLADSPGSFPEITSLQGPELVFSQYHDAVGRHEQVSGFSVDSVVLATKVTTRHFDWTHPSVPFEDASKPEDFEEDGRSPHGASFGPEREVYEHDDRPITFHSYSPGGGYADNDQRTQTKLRRQARARAGRVARGTSTVTDVKAAGFMTLVGHPQSELDGRYLVVDVDHSFSGSGDRAYTNYFRCTPESAAYRPRLLTPRPRAPSVQTATVVGPPGEEIHTDVYGRIKVQFHWDRLGASDEHSSCWIRVMQPWAGSGWGFVFIPRIGMEVVVNFVNGDLDQPLVVGSVYNADNPPPYSLPGEKTKSTIKTNSSLGGGGFNELRFEDKAGSEEIYTHAQKDYNEVVEHDHNTLVHNDQTNTVDKNQTEVVHVDQSLTVDNNRTKTVRVDQTSTIGGNDTTTVVGNRTETVQGNETATLQSNRAVSVMMNDNLSVLALKGVEVGLSYAIGVGVDYVLETGSSITLKTGDSKITMKSDGTIKIEGVKIEIHGDEKVKTTAPIVERNT